MGKKKTRCVVDETKLTDIAVRKYVRSEGTVCPYCGEETIETTGDLVSSNPLVLQDVKCTSCNKEWTDEYTLRGVSNS